MPQGEEIASLARHGATMVIFLSAGMLEALSARLMEGGYRSDAPAALVYKATWPEEKVVRCTVGELAQAGRDHQISRTALVVVGDILAGPYDLQPALPPPGFPPAIGRRPNDCGAYFLYREWWEAGRRAGRPAWSGAGTAPPVPGKGERRRSGPPPPSAARRP